MIATYRSKISDTCYDTLGKISIQQLKIQQFPLYTYRSERLLVSVGNALNQSQECRKKKEETLKLEQRAKV